MLNVSVTQLFHGPQPPISTENRPEGNGKRRNIISVTEVENITINPDSGLDWFELRYLEDTNELVLLKHDAALIDDDPEAVYSHLLGADDASE